MFKKIISAVVSGVMLCCLAVIPISVKAAADETVPPANQIPVNDSIKGLDDYIIKIMIDPGHYNYYNNSPVYAPYWESVMTWKLSNYLQAELRALGVHADLTKTSLDDNPSLNDRGFKSKGYDLFISMHSNAGKVTYDDQPLAFCYQNLPWTTIDDTSIELGGQLASTVSNVMGTSRKGAVAQRKGTADHDKNGVMDDEWYSVLFGARYVGTPGILLEHSYHTNYRASVWLYNEDNLHRLAKEEAAVIYNYFIKIKKPPEPKPELPPLPDKAGGLGDVNGDKAIDSIDASYVLAAYANKATGHDSGFNSTHIAAADVNKDGEVDSMDSSIILSYYAFTATGNKNTFEEYLAKK